MRKIHVFLSVLGAFAGAAVVGSLLQADPAADMVAPAPVGGATALGLNDDVQLKFGTSDDAACEYDTAQTPDSLICGVSSDSRALIIAEKADISTDFGHAQQTNPTLWIHAADATDTAKWGSLAHDGTNFIINSGKGTTLIDDTLTVSDTVRVADGDSPAYLEIGTPGAFTVGVLATKTGENGLYIARGTNRSLAGLYADNITLYSGGTVASPGTRSVDLIAGSNQGLYLNSTSRIRWSDTSDDSSTQNLSIYRVASTRLGISNNSTTGFVIDPSTANTMKVRSLDDSTDGSLTAGAATFSALTTLTGGVKLPTQTGATPSAPTAVCDSSSKGRLEVVDDNDDGAGTQICYCGMTDDTTYDWLNIADNTACTFY